ncbi:MAG: hypothetical protein WDN69_33400 [Aliidongia sp.]
MSEQQFVVAQRGDLRREMVGATAQETPTAPKVLVDTLYDLRNEHRVADYVFLPTSAVKDLPRPTMPRSIPITTRTMRASRRRNIAASPRCSFRSPTSPPG